MIRDGNHRLAATHAVLAATVTYSPLFSDVNDATPPKPYVKPRRVIKPSALAPEGYLETQAEIDAYLDKLGGAMEKVIAAGYRIEIRQVLDFTNTSSIRKK